MNDLVSALKALDRELLRLDRICAEIKAQSLSMQIQIGLLQQKKLIAEGKILFLGVTK